jgi:predicted lipoprotein with Yx(FWY)xxD motif
VIARPAALTVLVVAAALAGCGSGSGYGGGSSSNSSSNASAPPSKAGAVATKSTDLGTVVVDSNGRTLYMFAPDSATHSACNGACAKEWPPAAAGSSKPSASGGVTAAKLTTIKRSDGSKQLVYAGHPLYTFSGDSAAGDTKGQGVNAFGGMWNAVDTSGAAAQGSGSSGSSSAPSGY